MQTVIPRDGTRIAFRCSGDGPALLLVHGATYDHATAWRKVLPELERRFTVYPMDRRGRGGSGDCSTAREMRGERDYVFTADRFTSMRTPTLLLVGGNSSPGEMENARGVACARQRWPYPAVVLDLASDLVVGCAKDSLTPLGEAPDCRRPCRPYRRGGTVPARVLSGPRRTRRPAPFMDRSELTGILDFLRHAEQLKNMKRSAWTSGGEPESVAEHTWRLCLMALLLEQGFEGIDFGRLIRICIVHDLGEAIGGDIPAPQQAGVEGKAAQEREDLLLLLRPLPERLRREITELWDEYEAASTLEARVAKALDKLETILQHNQGRNPEHFDYRFNLDYGKRYTADDPLISGIRAILDEETEARARERAP